MKWGFFKKECRIRSLVSLGSCLFEWYSHNWHSLIQEQIRNNIAASNDVATFVDLDLKAVHIVVPHVLDENKVR